MPQIAKIEVYFDLARSCSLISVKGPSGGLRGLALQGLAQLHQQALLRLSVLADLCLQLAQICSHFVDLCHVALEGLHLFLVKLAPQSAFELAELELSLAKVRLEVNAQGRHILSRLDLDAGDALEGVCVLQKFVHHVFLEGLRDGSRA